MADPRVLRLIKKWLTAGVSEDGQWSESKVGTPQGAVISPLLANIYLHYAFDLWVKAWRKKVARGEMIVIRYADDAVLGFEHRADAVRFQKELGERLAKFGLELHPEKTRLIEFGRFAISNRRERGKGKPETFDFLGFTHTCGNCPAEDGGEEDARQAPSHQGGVEEAHARPAAQHGRMVAIRRPRLLSVLCSAGEYTDVERISIPVGAIVAARNMPSQSKAPAELGALGGAISPVAAAATRSPPVSSRSL